MLAGGCSPTARAAGVISQFWPAKFVRFTDVSFSVICANFGCAITLLPRARGYLPTRHGSSMLRANCEFPHAQEGKDPRQTDRQSQNLTRWSEDRESPTYQPRAKSIPRAEKRP